ncbi:MAG: hypothetical protein RMK49_21425, partial [Abditibacteriales bacterium]|nr:hypothetical protein [Abditibacteriales bacterium]
MVYEVSEKPTHSMGDQYTAAAKPHSTSIENDILMGPYALRKNDVDYIVQPRPGAYLLAGPNYHWRVGRAENNLQTALHQWIGDRDYV